MKGFEIGSTTNSCTKGIWIYPIPEKKIIYRDDDEKEVCIFVLDCEGSDSPTRDAKLDQKLLSLCLLVCSSFVWNAWKVVDENDILNLAALFKITERVIKTNKKDGLRVKDSFPKFYWALRDFSLDLKYDDSNTYLEKALMERPGEDNVIKNSARSFIKKIIKNRSCFTFPIPTFEQKKLAMLSDLESKDLRPEYLSSMELFKNRIKKEIQPKKWETKELDCVSWLSYVEGVVKYMNEEDYTSN